MHAKCFNVPKTPAPDNPFTQDAAIFPEINGSSEKYSKLRPLSGHLCMFTPGPSNTSTSLALNSIPTYSYISSTRLLFQVDARQVPLGISVALSPLSILIPEGPSQVHTVGTPYARSSSVTPPKALAEPALTLWLFIPSPFTRQVISSQESCIINSLSVFLPFLTSRRLIFFLPVGGCCGIICSFILSLISYFLVAAAIYTASKCPFS